MSLSWVTIAFSILIISSASDASQQRPRIFIYDLPPDLLSPHGTLGGLLVEKIRNSEYHEKDPDQADYFWIPGGGGYPAKGNQTGREFVISIFEYVRGHFPWWNKTMELGQARHIFVALFDAGLGECFHAPGMGKPNDLPSGQCINMVDSGILSYNVCS